MKANKSIVLAVIVMFVAIAASAQNADEIIGKYVQAIGGKDVLGKITSVYTESTIEVMGMQINSKTTILNGKGMKQEMEVMGSNMVTCLTDKGGWTINPMAGGTDPVDMPEAQFNQAKHQIVVGAPFVNYAAIGSKAELVGTDSVNKAIAYKIKITASDSTSALYYFDATTSFLVKSIQQQESQGQMVESVLTYSDYKPTEGFVMPYKMDMDMNGGQFTMSMAVTKVELNKPVDETIFSKPK